MIFGGAFAFRQRLLNDDVDRAAIFGMHADQAVVFGGLAHGAKDRGVIQHENAGIGHEQFEAGHAFANEFAHLFELRGAEVGDDAVEGVVGHGLVMRLFHPGIERLAQRLAFVLDGEIDQRGRPAESRGRCAGQEIVGAGGAAEGHVEVGMNVDAAGDDEQSGGVDDAASILDGKSRSDGRNLVANNADVGDEGVRRSDDRAVADDGIKAHGRTSSCARRPLLSIE